MASAIDTSTFIEGVIKMKYVEINDVVKQALLKRYAYDNNLGKCLNYWNWNDYSEAFTSKEVQLRLVKNDEIISIYQLIDEDWYEVEVYEMSDLIDYLCELVLNMHNKNNDLAHIVADLSADL